MPVPMITAHARRIGAELAGVGERVGRGREAELRDPVDAARLLRPEVRRRVEVADLAAEAHRQRRRVEALRSSRAVDRPATSVDQNVSRSFPAGVFTPSR